MQKLVIPMIGQPDTIGKKYKQINWCIGLSLKIKKVNTNEQSIIDCGNLWQDFEKGNYAEKIPDKVGDAIFAVYYQ